MSAVVEFAEIRKPEVETGSDLKAPLVSPPLPTALPLFESMISGEWRALRRPIGLKVRGEEGLVFVENDTLNLFGHGQTLARAIAEFRDDLEYYWNYYHTLNSDEVAGEGERLKRIYESLFE